MDISMPVMDGIEATRIIREQMPHIKVIALPFTTTTSRPMR